MADGIIRDTLARLLYEAGPEAYEGYLESLLPNDDIDTNLRIDGYINFAELARVVIDALPLSLEGPVAADDWKWRVRLEQESKDLGGKIDRLEKFMLTPRFSALSSDDRHDLHEQHNHMIAYHAVLARRQLRLPK